MAIMVGIGRGAKQGILVRDAEVLETLHKADTLVIDKTGTLTEGRPRLTKTTALSARNESDVLCWAASVESHSEHPLAAALVEKAKNDGLALRRSPISNRPLGWEWKERSMGTRLSSVDSNSCWRKKSR